MYSIKVTFGRAVIIALLFLSSIRFPVFASDIQAMWVVRDYMTCPEYIDKALEFAAENNFNHIFAQVRGRGDAYYKSDIVSRSDIVKSDFDPLDYILRQSKRFNIKVHAWINVYYLWSASRMPTQDNHILKTHPQWLDTKESQYVNVKKMLSTMNRSRVPNGEGFFLAPTHPDVEKYLLNIITEIVRKYPIDGLHFDYIRYHDFEYGFNPEGMEVFKDEYQSLDQTTYSVIREKPSWGDFRRNKITRFIEKASKIIRIYSSDIVISAAVKPNIYLARNRYGQEWDLWLSAGYIDWALPMNYAIKKDDFDLNLRVIQDNLPKKYHKKIIMGISTYNQSARSAGKKVLYARKLNFPNICVFSYSTFQEKPVYWTLLKRYFK